MNNLALEYKKFDLDDKKQKETFEDLLSRLTPKDVVELKMFERLGFGRPHNVEVHIVFNGDYTKEVFKK